MLKQAHKFVNKYSGTKWAHLYCKWASFIPYKSCLTLFCSDIHQSLFSTWMHVLNLSFSASVELIIINMIILKFHVYTEWKFQLGFFKPWWNFNLVYRDEVFAYNRNFIFTLLSLNIRDEISHYDKTLLWQDILSK